MQFTQSLCGDAEIIKWLDDIKHNLVHFAHELDYEGFELEMTGHRYPYILKNGKAGSSISFPVRGGMTPTSYQHLAFQLLAPEKKGATPIRCAVDLDGEPFGEFALDVFDGRYYLFFADTPYQYWGRSVVNLKVIEGEDVTITTTAFLSEAPKSLENEIQNVTVEDGRVRFITTVPSKGRVVCANEELSESGYYNCHSLDLSAKDAQAITIYAEDKDGAQIKQEWTAPEKQKAAKKKTASFSYELVYAKKDDIKSAATAFFGFSKGECFDVSSAGIRDNSGNWYPSDCLITSYWDGGSIKTVSVKTVIVPDGRKYFFATDATQVFDDEFKVSAEDGNIKLINASESFDFPENDEFLLPGIKAKNILYVNGARLEPVCKGWQVKRKGQAAIILEREGVFPAPANEQKLYIRLTFYRGIAGYLMEIGHGNEQKEPRLFEIDAFYLEFPEQLKTGTEDVLQLDEHFMVTGGEVKKARGDGKLELSEYKVHIKDFWQNYPKSISWDNDTAQIGLMPFLEHKEVYDEYTPEEKRQLLYFITDKGYQIHVGMRRLTKIGFSVTETEAVRLTETILMRPSLDEIEKSRAYGRVLRCCAETKHFDDIAEQGYKMFIGLKDKKREYGMFNYGDWHGERNINWGNNEYDLPYAGAIQFLRGAGEEYAKMGLLAAEHMEQVDHVRVHENEAFSGMFYLHTPGHSYYYEEFKDESAWEYFNVHVGHIFVHGLTEWYKITGEELFKNAVLRCADTLCQVYGTEFDFVTEREPAWAMLAMMDAFELTRDKKYLNACDMMVRRVDFKQDDKGCIKALLGFAETERKMIFGGKPFMCGLLMSALNLYGEASGDKLAEKVMIKLAYWLAKDMWYVDGVGFYYTDYYRLRERHSDQTSSIEIIEGLLLAYEKTGDPIFYDRASRVFDYVNTIEYQEHDVAKFMAMRLRFSPAILSLLHDASNGKKFNKKLKIKMKRRMKNERK